GRPARRSTIRPSRRWPDSTRATSWSPSCTSAGRPEPAHRPGGRRRSSPGSSASCGMAVSDRLAALETRWAANSAGAGAADSVYATLREAILDGLLRPGDGLIEERVARHFGVSRTPVREALLRLESEGLALRVPRRGL